VTTLTWCRRGGCRYLPQETWPAARRSGAELAWPGVPDWRADGEDLRNESRSSDDQVVIPTERRSVRDGQIRDLRGVSRRGGSLGFAMRYYERHVRRSGQRSVKTSQACVMRKAATAVRHAQLRIFTGSSVLSSPHDVPSIFFPLTSAMPGTLLLTCRGGSGGEPTSQPLSVVCHAKDRRAHALAWPGH